MGVLREGYHWLIRRLPPRVAWAVWRTALLAAAPRRRRVPPPGVALARVAWGVSEEQLGALVEELVRRAEAPPWHVLVVSDSDAVHVAAVHACRMEHVPGEAAWSQAFPDDDYERFLAERGRAIRDAYQIASLETPRGSPGALVRGLGGAGAG